eukprot:TRINITY_DN3240_c0_g2_i2.p1 TRINITY_DN3240_c0_g2~~TRINITY_DN3240_c0_g2_i2.p1  ORF type:complete len:299 (+),score=79.85 TRINITY_DN3240_c0_g2_i2:30-926(+)
MKLYLLFLSGLGLGHLEDFVKIGVVNEGFEFGLGEDTGSAFADFSDHIANSSGAVLGLEILAERIQNESVREEALRLSLIEFADTLQIVAFPDFLSILFDDLIFLLVAFFGDTILFQFSLVGSGINLGLLQNFGDWSVSLGWSENKNMGGSNAKALCVVNKLYPPAKGDAPITEILEKAKIDPAAYKAELEKDGIAEEGYEEEDEVIEKYGEEVWKCYDLKGVGELDKGKTKSFFTDALILYALRKNLKPKDCTGGVGNVVAKVCKSRPGVLTKAEFKTFIDYADLDEIFKMSKTKAA